MLHLISLGAGVQSSTMALMFAHGELTPMPDAAIFADTGAEPRYVYEWLDWLETKLPYPVHRVMRGEGLLNDLMARDGRRVANPPFFAGNGGLVRRQCTREYKVEPIHAKIRSLLGLAKGERAGNAVLAVQYIGISYDEVVRMKASRERWIEHRWPLVDRSMRRLDCLTWMREHGYPEPRRSACTFCPYHDDEEWKALKADPMAWAEVVKMDEHIRGSGTRERLYLHRSLKPITEVDFGSAEDHGQRSLFGEECEGMCGV